MDQKITLGLGQWELEWKCHVRQCFQSIVKSLLECYSQLGKLKASKQASRNENSGNDFSGFWDSTFINTIHVV